MNSTKRARGLLRAARCVLAALLVAAVFLFAIVPAFAAGGLYGNLNGTIVDASTRAPIAGAAIVANSGSGTYTAKTDGKGFFIILGMSVDSYTVTINAEGHETLSIPGVVVFGDETNTIATVALAQQLKTIAHVTSRSVSSAFQPTQTTDSYTVNQQQMLQSSGKEANANESAVLLAVPGVTLTNANNTSMLSSSVTIRGGAAAEVGYQYDGVPFKEPFLGGNAALGLINGAASVQVVEGAGDATQGEVGAGVINVVPQRGSGPGSGLLDAEIGGPNFNHQLAVNYGFSTPNDRVSEYISYIGQRFAPYYGYSFTPLDQYGSYFSTTNAINNQFTNNFFYKFGKNLSQQFQILYTNISQLGYTGATGCGGVYNAVTNPCALVYYPYDELTQKFEYLLTGFTPQQYSQLIGLTPGTPAANIPISQGQQNLGNNTEFLKLEYDNNVSATTYVALRYYNWGETQNTDFSYSIGPWQTGFPGDMDWAATGGQTVGTNLDIVHQMGSNLTVTLNGQYNAQYPQFDYYRTGFLPYALTGTGLSNQPTAADWLPGGYVYDYFCGSTPWVAGSARPSCLPRMPTWGIGYNGTQFQQWGTGLRLQYDPSERVKIDLGLRDEGQLRHWYSQLDEFGQGVPTTGYVVTGCTAAGFDPKTLAGYQNCPQTKITNPYDVPSSLWIPPPTVLQPRGSISWQLDRNDSLRFGYGRSAVFADSQTAGTPFHLWGASPFWSMPAIPAAAGVPTLCGWNTSSFRSAVFPCKSFGEQLYWQGDNLEAPDGEDLPPAIYTNYDLSYNHLFKSGWGMRVTPFIKEGTDLPTYYLLNPVLSVFAISTQGINKTAGLEFGLTTPTQPIGLSGFLSATYQNVLSTTPPFTTGETTVPLNTLATLELGDLYRAGYVSPFDLRIGAVENLKDGFTISPQIEYNIGYPYSVGNMIAGCVALNPNGTCAKYANIAQVDFGPGVTYGQSSLIGGNPGASIATNYYDPAYPGNSFKPNVDASRGTPATAANGGILSHPNMQAALSLQWKHQGNTLGVQFLNLFGNAWVNSVPAISPWYQPVANGISGPQTGINSCVNQTGAGLRGCYAAIPKESYAFTNGAYLLSNGNFTGTPAFGPITPFSVQVYYQRSL
jgi:hypothetical protein